MSKSKVLFQVTGSIAAFKAAAAVSKLVQQGYDVKVVFSNSASRFIGASTFEGLTGHRVYSDMFDALEPMAHIDLSRWADLMVLCPASANSLAQLANGFAGDLIGTLFLAKEAHVPYLIFPAMNPQMWSAVTVQENWKKLNTLSGVKGVLPSTGNMACGEFGEGRLPEAEEIVNEITSALSQTTPKKAYKILITGGGTSEPIDSVRSITNFSTGKTAVGLSNHLSSNGFDVELLLANTALIAPIEDVKVKRFTTHHDLEELLRSELSRKKYDAVVHLAAVSDYKIDEVQKGKISSSLPDLNLKLIPTVKLVHSLKEWSSNKKVKVVAFKLTSDADMEDRLNQAYRLLEKNPLDGVVLNDLSDIQTQNEKSHSGILITPEHKQLPFKTKSELYETLEKYLEAL